jgi:hypothetical protein
MRGSDAFRELFTVVSVALKNVGAAAMLPALASVTEA